MAKHITRTIMLASFLPHLRFLTYKYTKPIRGVKVQYRRCHLCFFQHKGPFKNDISALGGVGVSQILIFAAMTGKGAIIQVKFVQYI